MRLETGGLSVEEQLIKEMRRRIKEARANPISETRLAELDRQAAAIYSNFINRGHKTQEERSIDESIYEELKRSSVMAYNLAELKIMLGEMESTKRDAIHIMEHENAHANVAERTGHKFLGYGVLFIRTNAGYVYAPNIVTWYEEDPSWTLLHVIEKDLEVLRAPEVYGNRLSEGDKRLAALNRERYKKIKAKREDAA